MAKIVGLIPCLMLPNNRQANYKALIANQKNIPLDEWIIYDQCFEKEDLLSGFTYIGHATERMGWVEPRNALLKYFYDSDYDYAFWIDANSDVSKPTLNDLITIINNIKSDKFSSFDCIFSTLGMWVSQDRISYKSAEDFLENVHLKKLKQDRSYNWMHGLIMRNFKKYSNVEYYVDSRCDTRQGTADDVYFARLLRSFTTCFVAPTVVINKPSSKASCTWANDKGTYDYPPTLFDVIDRYIVENQIKYGYASIATYCSDSDISFTREDTMKEFIRPYVPRKSKEVKPSKSSDKVILY